MAFDRRHAVHLLKRLVHKFIAKYGLAAHLALLAVTPLFLYPFFDSGEIAVALLWLSLPAAVWALAEPSVRSGELLREARSRVASAVLRDPLFWMLAVVLLVTGFRALNTGIELAYDAENNHWFLAEPAFPLLPGSVKGTAFLPFAGVLALTVVVQGCRHVLGKAARAAFLLSSSALAGAAALLSLVLLVKGNVRVQELVECRITVSSFLGPVFAVYFLAAMAALVGAFERSWRQVMPLFAFSVGGCLAGAFAFSTPAELVVFAAAALLLLAYVFVYLVCTLKASSEFKYLVVFGVAATLGGLALVSLLPARFMGDRTTAFLTTTFFPVGFLEMRAVLSEVAFKVWKIHLWLGSGLGSFPIDIRFHAVESDWMLLLPGQSATMNGWWQLLAERGVVGALLFAVPLGAMLFTYFRRMLRGVLTLCFPNPASWLGLLTLLPVVACAFVDCSFMRVEMILAVGAVLAVSANAFPKEKRRDG